MSARDERHSARILVVDDDENLRLILSDRLLNMGHQVREADSLAAALKCLSEDSFQLLFLDVYLPDQANLEGLRQIRQDWPTLPIIVMTAHGTIDLAVIAMKEGAYDFVTKPMDFKRLGVVVDRALESSQLRTEISYLRRAADAPFHDIVGEQGGLKASLDLARQVADSDATVLLRGETGTGKEVVARAIHRLSSRRDRPFVVANCAAIPRELMESEMFGHRRGAFTGAVADQAGFFEAAGGGTLLLDEIGDLDLDLQAKILHVLEDGSYRKVGSTSLQRNRARVIASTHQPLEKMMEEGRFREDLFYRLNVFPIELPALRERLEDIPDLARHFLKRTWTRHPDQLPRLTPEAVEALRSHPWQGNLRELRNCMERVALTVGDDRITAESLAPLLHRRVDTRTTGAAASLKDLERKAIVEALARHDGNRTRAAEALGIGRRTLQNKLKLYGLAEESL
jgi:DNA-binding NtrC family response regulator